MRELTRQVLQGIEKLPHIRHGLRRLVIGGSMVGTGGMASVSIHIGGISLGNLENSIL